MLPGEWWAQLLALGVIGAAAWIALQPRCAFVIQIAQGIPKTVRGKVTAAFLEQVREVCEQHSVRQGIVRGLVRGRRALPWAFPPASRPPASSDCVIGG